MITLNEAIRIAEIARARLMEGTATVDQIIDCGEKWLMAFAEDTGCCGTLPLFVTKKNGEWEPCEFNEEQLDLILQGVDIPLPRQERTND